MDSPRPGVDLEKELTCSICTDVLYQPLTLLDCLHTFCGSCLKEWFGWQATAAENSPNPPAPGSQIFTCPSCRAPVRDTRHNATVATLLEMFLAANPDKAKSEGEKEEMRQRYKPGDNVIPSLRSAERSPEERRLDRLERRMLEQARELSLREVGVETGEARRARRHRDESSSRDGRSASDREHSNTRHRETRNRNRTAAVEDSRRQRGTSNATLQPDGATPEGRRRRRSESRQRSRESSQTRRRNVEHQASIRSLISSSDVDSRDLEREIEDFARQIQEEGLLDGLDLDNIDLTRDDDLSRRITEAYRRRQRNRAQLEAPSGRDGRPHSRSSEAPPSSTLVTTDDSSRTSSRQRAHSAHGNQSDTPQSSDRTRPPISSAHLGVNTEPERRRRRRTASGGRSATDPIRPRSEDTRPASRSQTDLGLRTQTSDPNVSRPSLVESRSSSMPIASSSSQIIGASFSVRATAAPLSTESPAENSNNHRTRRANRPSSLIVSPASPLPSLGPPLSPSGHQRSRPQSYPEPSITCSRCQRPHIEYELHYNCSKCNNGDWNICISCFRTGQGCLHWYGFGYAAFNRWEKARKTNPHLERLHLLTANRYLPPKQIPGGAEGRRAATTEDPGKRLQSGSFCSHCLAWANDCYWRCDICNEGDWGFCNDCTNQGRSCTHDLLPLTYAPQIPHSRSPPGSPRSPRPPPTASILTGPHVTSIGSFKPLAFTTTCDICRKAIPPVDSRYHCFTCKSTVVPDTQAGDYDICMDCYGNAARNGQISSENGPGGWRRCLNGHRMVIIGFEDSSSGRRRCLMQDLVGGRGLHAENFDSPGLTPDSRGMGLQKWWWHDSQSGHRLERLVTRDVKASAPSGAEVGDGEWTQSFPPDGGVGLLATAIWPWYPQAGADDELTFPKGAQIMEVEDVNGDWFFGVYMGEKGLFPAPYARIM